MPAILAVSKRFLDGGHPLLVGIGLFAVVATALGVYAKVQAYAEHSKHYERMRLLFWRAGEKFRELLKPGQHREDEVQDLIMDLGKEALIENSDWVLLHRERPPEMKG